MTVLKDFKYTFLLLEENLISMLRGALTNLPIGL